MTESDDRLRRRQSIIDGFKTPYNFAERIMQLEDECRMIADRLHENMSEYKGGCHFPRHTDKYGFTTHKQYINVGEAGGLTLERCVVCDSVRAVVLAPEA